MTSRLVIVAGTGTEVGKTWFATRYLALARAQKWTVSARKPAQSFSPDDGQATDAELLAAASGESPIDVCPKHRWYETPMAPPMAADALGRDKIRLDDLLTEMHWPAETQLKVVETAGGLLSPIAHDADNYDLIRALQPDRVILVADAGLGTLNAVRLCARVLQGFEVKVFLNRFDAGNPLHVANRLWLCDGYGIDAVINVADYLASR